MTLIWCDRKNYKEKFTDWLKDKKSIVIGASDSQEIRDISSWVREKATCKIGKAIYDSDVEIQRHILLEALTYDLGYKNKFPNFFELREKIKNNIKPLTITQITGHEIEAREDVHINGTSQVVNIRDISNLKITPEVSREMQANDLLDEFIKDLQSITSTSHILFLIQFGKEGFSKFSTDFKHWFLHIFCPKILLCENVKICVLNQGELNAFANFENACQEKLTENLGFDDIMEETKNYIENYEAFCCGAIDPDTKSISYNEFKRKLSTYINRV